MFWKRTTAPGAFWGLLSGTVGAAIHHGLSQPIGETGAFKGAWLVGGHAIIHYPSDMAQNFWTAIVAWVTCFVVTIAISLATPRTKSDEELRGLVYSETPRPVQAKTAWYKQPAILGAVVLIAAVVFNIIFF
jgi:SSS family solute:Na+ symporter